MNDNTYDDLPPCCCAGMKENERLKREVMELRAMVNELRTICQCYAEDLPKYAGRTATVAYAISLLDKTPTQSLEDYCTSVIEDEHTNKWKRVVIEALIVDCIYRKDHDTDPKAALNELLCYERKMALDPQISEDAYDYGMRVAEAVREACWGSTYAGSMCDCSNKIRNLDLAPIVKGVE